MLVIKVELWPGGSADRAREIGRIGLANVSNLRSTSDYVFVSADDRGNFTEGAVTGHERNDGFWKLIQRIAGAADRGGSKVPAKHKSTVREVGERMKLDTTSIPLRFSK